MTSDDLITAVRISWLTLCGMMLFSRFVFQAAGAVWMRSFLDTWKYSRTHHVWGVISLIYGVGVLVGTLLNWSPLSLVDRSISVLLAMVLSADGLLNLLPSWFGNFKERMQDSWVKRHASSKKVGDKHLFGTVNFFLGVASLAVASFVYWYKPLSLFWLGMAAGIAIIVMSLLIIGCKAEAATNA